MSHGGGRSGTAGTCLPKAGAGGEPPPVSPSLPAGSVPRRRLVGFAFVGEEKPFGPFAASVVASKAAAAAGVPSSGFCLRFCSDKRRSLRSACPNGSFLLLLFTWTLWACESGVCKPGSVRLISSQVMNNTSGRELETEVIF